MLEHGHGCRGKVEARRYHGAGGFGHERVTAHLAQVYPDVGKNSGIALAILKENVI